MNGRMSGARNCALILAILFAWSAGGKIFWTAQFAEMLRSLGVIPAWLTEILAYVIPAAELMIAVLYATDKLPLLTGLASLVLSTIFVVNHVFLLVTGNVKPCGCAGVLIRFEGSIAHAVMAGVSAGMIVLTVLTFGREKNHSHVVPNKT